VVAPSGGISSRTDPYSTIWGPEICSGGPEALNWGLRVEEGEPRGGEKGAVLTGQRKGWPLPVRWIRKPWRRSSGQLQNNYLTWEERARRPTMSVRPGQLRGERSSVEGSPKKIGVGGIRPPTGKYEIGFMFFDSFETEKASAPRIAHEGNPAGLNLVSRAKRPSVSKSWGELLRKRRQAIEKQLPTPGVTRQDEQQVRPNEGLHPPWASGRVTSVRKRRSPSNGETASIKSCPLETHRKGKARTGGDGRGYVPSEVRSTHRVEKPKTGGRI